MRWSGCFLRVFTVDKNLPPQCALKEHFFCCKNLKTGNITGARAIEIQIFLVFTWVKPVLYYNIRLLWINLYIYIYHFNFYTSEVTLCLMLLDGAAFSRKTENCWVRGRERWYYVHTIYLSINIESIFRFHIPLTFFLSSFFIQSIINTKYSLNIINETGNLLHEKTTFMGIPGWPAALGCRPTN